jgi:hypothetical protein
MIYNVKFKRSSALYLAAISKENNKSDVGFKTSCREKFKKLQILTVPSFYILDLIMFKIKSTDIYQTNASVHSRDTRQKINFIYIQ